MLPINVVIRPYQCEFITFLVALTCSYRTNCASTNRIWPNLDTTTCLKDSFKYPIMCPCRCGVNASSVLHKTVLLALQLGLPQTTQHARRLQMKSVIYFSLLSVGELEAFAVVLVVDHYNTGKHWPPLHLQQLHMW